MAKGKNSLSEIHPLPLAQSQPGFYNQQKIVYDIIKDKLKLHVHVWMHSFEVILHSVKHIHQQSFAR